MSPPDAGTMAAIAAAEAESASAEVPCRSCSGRGHHISYHSYLRRGQLTGRAFPVPCMICGGKGRLNAADAALLDARQAEGARRRVERMARCASLTTAARVLGVSPQELAKMEAGRLPFPDQEQRKT